MKSRRSALPVLAALGICGALPLAWAAKDKPRMPDATLTEFRDLAIEAGRDLKYPSTLALLVDINRYPDSKTFSVPAKNAADSRTHVFSLLIKEEGAEAAQIPKKFLFITKKRSSRSSTKIYYLVNLDGELEKAWRIESRHRAHEKGVIGSSRVNQLDIQDGKIRRGLRREFDFWLKGRYRRKIIIRKRSKRPVKKQQ